VVNAHNVARLGEVSQATVSRVLNEPGMVSAVTRCRVLREAVRRGSPVVLVNRVVDGMRCDKVDSDTLLEAVVELLVARLDEPPAPHAHRRLPAALITRHSTGFTPQRR
jgi:DNA-binding LacI/PurR family transcriptional regulator